MKILFLTNRIPFPTNDGGSKAMQNMMLGLKKAGAQISLFSINTNKHHKTLFDLSVEFKSLFDRFYAVDLDTRVNVKDAFLNLFTKKSYNVDRFEDKTIKIELTRFVKTLDVDIVQFEGVYISMYYDIIRKELPKAKLVLRTHNIEFEIWERLASNAKFLKKKYLQLLASRLKEYELSIYSRFDLLLAISDRDKNKLRDLCAVPCRVSTVGLEIENISEAKDVKNNLFFIGSLDWRPNKEGLLWFIKEIWPTIHKKFPQFTFSIAGRNTPKSIKKWNGKSNIFIHGEVDSPKEFIQEHGLMVVPILSGSGTRVKIIEAMMLEKCVLSTSVGVEGLPLQNEKHYFLTNTLEDFIDVITQLSSNDKKREMVEVEAKKIIRNSFDLEQNSTDLYKYYTEFID